MTTEYPDYIELKTTAKTVSTNAELVLRENNRRRYLIVQNVGSVAIYLAFGDTRGPLVSSTTGLKLNAGESFELPRALEMNVSGSVYATAASTNCAVLVTEGAYAGEFASFDPPPAGASSSSSSSSSSSPSSASSASSASSSSSSST